MSLAMDRSPAPVHHRSPVAIQWSLLVLGLALAPTAFGQTHDLSLEIVVDAPDVTPPGFTGNITFTVTNHGPDTAGAEPPFFSVRASLRDIVTVSSLYGELLDYEGTSPLSDCRISAGHINPLPGEPPGVAYLINFPTMAPGQSRTCRATFTVNTFSEIIDPEEVADGLLVHRWSASAAGTDPNPDNDRVTVVYRLNATPIPTLQRAGVIIFILMIILAYFTIAKRLT